MCRALPRAPCLRCTLTPRHQAQQISPSSSSQQQQPSGRAAGEGLDGGGAAATPRSARLPPQCAAVAARSVKA